MLMFVRPISGFLELCFMHKHSFVSRSLQVLTCLLVPAHVKMWESILLKCTCASSSRTQHFQWAARKSCITANRGRSGQIRCSQTHQAAADCRLTGWVQNSFRFLFQTFTDVH